MEICYTSAAWLWRYAIHLQQGYGDMLYICCRVMEICYTSAAGLWRYAIHNPNSSNINTLKAVTFLTYGQTLLPCIHHQNTGSSSPVK